MLWSAAAILASGLLAGCASRQFVGDAGPVLAALDNPMFVAVPDREFLWDQVVDTVDNYFRVARERRPRVIGEVLTEGQLETQPLVAATYLEPWREDSTLGFERLHATYQSIRRRALVRATPAQGGFLVHVEVLKELEDLSRPEDSPVSSTNLRHDGTFVRQNTGRVDSPATLGWIPLGRDKSLEQQILAEIRARTVQAAAPERLPPTGF